MFNKFQNSKKEKEEKEENKSVYIIVLNFDFCNLFEF